MEACRVTWSKGITYCVVSTGLIGRHFNTLWSEQNDPHFADSIVKLISFNKTYSFEIKFHWNLFRRVRLPATHYLNHWWPSLMVHICPTQPRWDTWKYHWNINAVSLSYFHRWWWLSARLCVSTGILQSCTKLSILRFDNVIQWKDHGKRGKRDIFYWSFYIAYYRTIIAIAWCNIKYHTPVQTQGIYQYLALSHPHTEKKIDDIFITFDNVTCRNEIFRLSLWRHIPQNDISASVYNPQ